MILFLLIVFLASTTTPAQAYDLDDVASPDIIHFNDPGSLYLQADVDSLFYSVLGGDRETVAHYLEWGVPVDVRDRSMHTPLERASIGSYSVGNIPKQGEMVKFLLEHGADVNGVDSLCAAVYAQCDNSIICDRSAELLWKDDWGINFFSGGSRVRLYGKPLLLATRSSNLEVASVLLDYGADADVADSLGVSPLFYAVRMGDVGLARRILEGGARIRLMNCESTNLLRDAVMFGEFIYSALPSADNVGMVELLLEYGVYVDTTHPCDCWTALMALSHEAFCVDRDLRLSLTTLLLERGSNVNAGDGSDATPLHWAVWSGDIGLVQLFLDWGVDVDAVDDIGRTPLYAAVRMRDIEIVKLLIDWGADVKEYGGGALGLAVDSESLDILQLLLEHGADVNAVEVDAVYPCTPLCRAVKRRSSGILRLLLEFGAKDTEKNSGNPCNLGRSLSEALWRSDLDAVKLLLEYTKDAYDCTHEAWAEALMQAAVSARDNQELVSFVLDHEVNVDAFRSDTLTFIPVNLLNAVLSKCLPFGQCHFELLALLVKHHPAFASEFEQTLFLSFVYLSNWSAMIPLYFYELERNLLLSAALITVPVLSCAAIYEHMWPSRHAVHVALQ